MAAAAASRLLKPDILARLGTLELVARTVVDGVLTGLHRSPDFGFSQEFAEYRAYNEGDDLRFVDWNVYARADRMYIKRFRGETNTAVTLLLDVSASMGFGEPVSKLDQAKFLVASLAYLTRRQHDALGLVIFDDEVREHMLPNARPDSLAKVLGTLERSEAGSGTDILEVLRGLQINQSRRGLLVLVSDLYTDPDELMAALQPMVHGGQDIAVFHVLDKLELEPDIKKVSALRDIETDEKIIVDPEFLNAGYQQKMQAHCEKLSQNCLRTGADYVRVTTSDALDSAIAEYLQFRERRSR